MAKKGKAKISKIKRNNQTTNKMKKQGKLKLQRHRTTVQKQKQPLQVQPEYSSESESSNDEWGDMLDDDEKEYITQRLAKQPQLLSNIPETDQNNKLNSKRKRNKEKGPKKPPTQDGAPISDSDNSDVEDTYEHDMAERPVKKLRPLLPIKTKEGFMERAEECDDSESENEKVTEQKEEIVDTEKTGLESEDSGVETSDAEPVPEGETITTVELLAARRDRLQHDKLRIGALCSSLLETPEKKLKNLFPILYLMEERLKDGTPNLHSIRKLAMLSAAEVFKDLLPEYRIRHQDYSDVKLKKDTLALYKYEKEMVEFYKRYLQRLEKAANVLRRKKGDHRKLEEPEISLAIVSLRCMCGLLVARPDFNYAINIAQSVIPFLDAKDPGAREIVSKCCIEVFAEDKKGDITLDIVRLINQLVKRRGERLHPSALDCLLTLNIRDVELDAETDLKHKKHQDEKHKKRIVNLSKKEKKRAKKLKEVERELLETEAQESEAARRRQLTEVTRVLFHVYFRLLKTAPRSQLLTAALDGLAKFTHVINLEYYSDLVGILSALLRDPTLALRPRLQVVRTVLAVLAGAGDALAVDPAVFHAALHSAALDVHAGGSQECCVVLLEALAAVTARARRVSAAVLQACAKRLATLALQVQHHAALAALVLLQRLTQSGPCAALLETEAAGSGRYDPLSPSPEHCGAHAAGLRELDALRRHYHPRVRDAARALARRSACADLARLSPTEVCAQYDGSLMGFRPAVPPPAPRASAPARVKASGWAQHDFRDHCLAVEDQVPLTLTEPVVR